MSRPADFERSIERFVNTECHRSKATGFGTTKQGRELRRKHREQLAVMIAADLGRGAVEDPRDDRVTWADVPKLRKALTGKARAHVRDKTVVRALKDIDADKIALHLLIAGISVAEGVNLGVDDNGNKNFRDQAVWIGRNLGGLSLGRKFGLKVGAWGINMLIRLSAFDVDDGGVLRMTVSADDVMDEAIENGFKNHPLLYPLTTPPVPWTQVRKGVLPADHWAAGRIPFIRLRHPSIEAAAKKAIGERRMQPVLDAVNVLQRVAFTINKPVLDFIHRWGKPNAPEGSRPLIWQQEKRREWDKALAAAGAFHIDMVTADAMAGVEHFWVPLNIDFRGRIYGIPHFNFAREDHVRALFLFADGEPIGEEGLKWLKAHVAGSAGGPPRKWGHYARIKWTEANLEQLREVGRAVLRRDDPATIAWPLPKKDRYQFLAACVELDQAIDKGPDFKTRLPLMFDGSCSGLQHMCAMTRAEEGKFVNLTDAFDPEDFYTCVANGVWDTAPQLRHLMQERDDRDVVKRPTVSYFYGSRAGGFSGNTEDETAALVVEKPHLLDALLNGTATEVQKAEWKGKPRAIGMVEQIIDVLEERGKNHIDGAEVVKLAQAIYKSIGEMAPSAKAVLKFLRRLARLCAKEGKPLRWTTPAGLPVINACYEAEIEFIRVVLKDRPRAVKLAIGDKDSIHEKNAVKSAAANFIHSLDAVHLQAVAIEAAKAGIEIACIHDCFGSIAPRAGRLKEAIRVKFVQLHKRNLLAEVLAATEATLPKSTKLPPLPKTGTLKLEAMYSNYHAFKN